MNAPFDPASLAGEKFSIGQPVSRKEDPVLLRGEGRYTDDLNRPDQLFAVMVRSRVAHGDIRAIDLEAALEMPGIRAVVTATELDRAGIGNMPAAAGKHRDGTPTPRPPQRPLATNRVRYVGEPIAMVIADTVKLAKDAAETVYGDIDPLPAVTTAGAAATPRRRGMSVWISISAIAKRSPRLLPGPPTSHDCPYATTASAFVQWHRVTRSVNTTLSLIV